MTAPEKNTPDKLIDLTDQAAEALLRQVLNQDTMSEREAEFLAEKTRAFDSVSKWLLVRIKAAPPQPTESKFGGILQRLESPPERRKTGRRGTAAIPDEPPPFE